MIHNKMARCAVALVIGVAAVALAGCGTAGSLIQQKRNGHVETVDYATGAIGKSNQNARLPSWVPDQASSVSEAIRTTGSERILRFTLTAAGSENPGRPARQPHFVTMPAVCYSSSFTFAS